MKVMVPVQELKQEPERINSVESVDTTKIIKEMKNLFEEYSEKNKVSYDGEASTELNDEEVEMILERLLAISKNIFPDIPLNPTLSKEFIWNIPKEIYELYLDVYSDIEHPILDPIVILYIFCAEHPRYAMGRFMQVLMLNFEMPEIQEAINESADKWSDIQEEIDE